jgi:hypothetical protein
MKKFTLALAAFAVAGSLMAQENRFSLGAEVAFPMGDLAMLRESVSVVRSASSYPLATTSVSSPKLAI